MPGSRIDRIWSVWCSGLRIYSQLVLQIAHFSLAPGGGQLDMLQLGSGSILYIEPTLKCYIEPGHSEFHYQSEQTCVW